MPRNHVLLVRGPVVMRGYRNKPDNTAETIDADGWLHTGDIATIDSDGYISIVDRKKELIINSAGENMSPTSMASMSTSAEETDVTDGCPGIIVFP